MQLRYMNELYSSVDCAVITLCVALHIVIRDSSLSCRWFSLVYVMLIKAPCLVNGAWVTEKTL